MNKIANVEILMSTFNGEKFLRQQMDSVLAQKGDFNLKISVRDDGSTDSTCDILKEYQKDINVTFGENIGVNASIMELVKASEQDFDYFAFCDQDDIWYDFRINEAVAALSAFEKDEPALWSCMEELTNESLIPYGLMPYPKYLGDFYNAIIQNKTAGHTQVFNKALRDMYIYYPADKMYVYDWVLYILASEFGTVCYCDRVCGQYRQHGANSIGYEINPVSQIRRRLKRLLNGDFKHIATQLCYIFEIYENKLPKEHREELYRFLKNRNHILKRIGYAMTTKIKRNSMFESFQFRCLYVLGMYGKERVK
jgi:glycosyltransferase involved in cell wall biosynthesis